MKEGDYAFLVSFLKRRSGLSLGPEKKYLVESRLAPICRAAGLDGLGALVLALQAPRGTERLANAVVDAMATHETLFFRDGAPFDTLRRVILPGLAAKRPPETPIRIWSAAASTGQEAYSIAMLVAELGRDLGHAVGAGSGPWRRRRVEILGTDIAQDAVARARAGIYSQFEVQRGLPIRSLLRHFHQTKAGWEILPELRAMVEFRVFNLMEDCRPLGSFDVIFCRNLLIYLDQDTKRAVLNRLAAALAPDGVLCLGSAETTIGLTQSLQPHGDERGYFGAASQGHVAEVAAGMRHAAVA